MTLYVWHDGRGWCWGSTYPEPESRPHTTEDEARRALLAQYPQAIIRTLNTRQ